jgi:hypothetical protein
VDGGISRPWQRQDHTLSRLAADLLAADLLRETIKKS